MADNHIFSNLPSDVHRHILIHLPPRSLFRFRSVCKTWLKIIDDKSFIQTQSINNSYHSTTIGVVLGSNKQLFSLSLDSLNSDDTTNPQEIDATPIEQLETDRQLGFHETPIRDLVDHGVPNKRAFLGPSCNGLILVYDFTTEVIWNPLTRDYHKLPEPKGFGSKHQRRILGAGFGYNSATDDYKVVRIYKQEQPGEGMAIQITLVYSLRLGVWRARSQCYIGGYWLAGFGVFLNGALHFATTEGIVVFDLGTEKYRPFLMPLPSSFLPGGMFRDFTVLRGCLVFCWYNWSMKCFKIWRMKENQQENGTWMEWFTIGSEDQAGLMISSVAYLESKKTILLHHLSDDGLYWIDTEDKSVKRVMVDDKKIFKFTSHQSFPGSLFRLNNSGGSFAGGPTQRNRERGDDHKRLCLKFRNISSYKVLDNDD